MNKLLYILLLFATLFVGGCSTLDDDLSDCVQMRVYVDFDDPDAVEWGNYRGFKTLDDHPDNVKLYVYDKYDTYLATHYITTQKVYDLPYKEIDSVQYVAIVANDVLDNIYPDFIKGSRLIKGTKADTSFITLKDAPPYYDILNISRSPHDFQMKYGFVSTIRKDNEMAPHYIYVERKIGAIRCIIIGLNEYLNKENSVLAQKDEPYTIVFGETPKEVSFEGRFTNKWTHHILPILSEVNDTITTEFVNTFPTSPEKESVIKIFKYNYEILKKDAPKNSAVVRAGRATTVIINFIDIVPPNEGGTGITSDKWDTVNVYANF